MNDSKIINDPVFGFIKIPRGILLDIIQHPLMQRLTRIKQLGLTSMVYPGAQHVRFQHSIGALHLMMEAINSLTQKGIFIFDSEAEAVEIAILTHDIGHGPFSHVLEHTLIKGINHEEISLLMMKRINKDMRGALALALKIFQNDYPKKFLHQLISSQLDMDRLDYLRRDSFYTGINEGSIGSARIIKMLDVADDQLVVNSKGIYSIENYLTSRRLMYWQVYLHKTKVACERMLVNALSRAKELSLQGMDIYAPPSLKYFLQHDIGREEMLTDEETFQHFASLDDNDIWTSLKVWTSCNDVILATLSKGLVERKLFKVEVSDTPPTEEHLRELSSNIVQATGISTSLMRYFLSAETIQKDMYDMNDDHIDILYKDGTVKDISEASELLNVSLLSQKNRKYYLSYLRV